MKSMTGFGRATASLGSQTLTAQVNSVNRKTLDLTVKLPVEWEALEPQINDLVRKYAVRGKVHVDLELTGANGEQSAPWDEAAAAEVLAKLAAFAGSGSCLSAFAGTALGRSQIRSVSRARCLRLRRLNWLCSPRSKRR